MVDVERAVQGWMDENPSLVVLHARGKIILAPPGSGKSTFVAGLPSPKAFVDSDDVLGDTGLGIHPQSWHSQKHSARDEEKHYRLCEMYLRAMRMKGVWVVSSLFEDMDPDCIVLPPVEQHRAYVAKRPDLQWGDVDRVRRLLEAKTSVPQFASWDAMARTLHFMAE